MVRKVLVGGSMRRYSWRDNAETKQISNDVLQDPMFWQLSLDTQSGSIFGVRMSAYVLHAEPVWRDRADFIVNASVEGISGVDAEQLWTRRDADNHLYEVCCIPFFVYDLALGDLISVRVGTDGSYLFDEVVERSGGYTFRIYFGRTDPASQARVLADLAKAPVRIERYSQTLVAVDIREVDSPQRLADYLAQAESEGFLVYESGRSANPT